MFIANPQQPGNSSSSRMVRPIIGVPLRERQPSAEQIGFIESPLLVDTPPMSPEAYLRGDEDEGNVVRWLLFLCLVLEVSGTNMSASMYEYEREHYPMML